MFYWKEKQKYYKIFSGGNICIKPMDLMKPYYYSLIVNKETVIKVWELKNIAVLKWKK